MKAVIFAAGEGKRLHPLTLERPKPLVEVLGKPLIQHIWEAIPSEIDEVVIVVGYKADMIRAFLGADFMGKKVTYVEQTEPLGTGHALMLCKPYLKDEEKFLLMYADDIHGKEGIARCIKQDMALLCSTVEDPRNFGVIVPNEDGTIKDIEEKPEHPKSNLAFTGVCVLNSKIFDYEVSLTHKGEYYLTDMIERYIHEHPIQIVESDLWLPVGYPHDIKRAEEILSGTPTEK